MMSCGHCYIELNLDRFENIWELRRTAKGVEAWYRMTNYNIDFGGRMACSMYCAQMQARVEMYSQGRRTGPVYVGKIEPSKQDDCLDMVQ